MEKTYLPLVGDYALEVLSYYIWGQSSKPSNIADEKYADKTDSITLTVSVNEFMHRHFGINTADDFKELVAKNVNMFGLFFENRSKTGVELDFSAYKHKIKDGKLVLSHTDFVDIFYKGSDEDTIREAKNPEISFSMYKQDPSKVEEFAQAAFVFGSSKFTFNANLENDKIQYVFNVDEQGTITPSHIENLKFTLDTDNFDFKSSDGFAKIVNSFLKDITDPNGIGKIVNIEFENDFYSGNQDIASFNLSALEYSVLSKQDLNQSVIDNPRLQSEYIRKYFSYFKKIINSDIINYSADGKYVIYGDKNGNTLSNTTTKENVDLSNIDIDKLVNSICDFMISNLPFLAYIKPLSDTLNDKIDDTVIAQIRNEVYSMVANLYNPHKDRLEWNFISWW